MEFLYQQLSKQVSNASLNMNINCRTNDINDILGEGNWKAVFESRDLNTGNRNVKSKKSKGTRRLLIKTDDRYFKVEENFIDNFDVFCKARKNDINIDNIHNDLLKLEFKKYQKAFKNWNQPWTSNILHKHPKCILIEYFPKYTPLTLLDLVPLAKGKLRQIVGLPQLNKGDIISMARENKIYKDIVKRLNQMAIQNSFSSKKLYTHYTKLYDIQDDKNLFFKEPFKGDNMVTITYPIAPILELYDLTEIVVLKDNNGSIIDWKLCEPWLHIQPQPDVFS